MGNYYKIVFRMKIPSTVSATSSRENLRPVAHRRVFSSFGDRLKLNTLPRIQLLHFASERKNIFSASRKNTESSETIYQHSRVFHFRMKFCVVRIFDNPYFFSGISLFIFLSISYDITQRKKIKIVVCVWFPVICS